MYLSLVSINLLVMTGVLLESWRRDYSIPGTVSVLVNCKNIHVDFRNRVG
jgi:hypothetical protein